VLKVAIIGCGKIADSHAAQILRVPGARIVAACDREPMMVRQLCDRFPIESQYSNLQELLQEKSPDVVHITTPPESHFSLAKQCLEAGSHVYVEKPFTLNGRDAEALVKLAEDRRLKITVGHDDQFSNVARRMRTLIQSGYLGQAPIHMESYYSYELSDAGYSGALLGDKGHWVRKLPGKLLHNIISHGIARIAEHFTSSSPHVQVYGEISPYLRKRGETEIVDELRVILSEESGRTAYFTFSSQMRPLLHGFRIYGNKNGLWLDQDQELLIKLPGKRHKSYIEKFLPPLTMAGQYLSNLRTNAVLFLNRDFHMKAGMKYLIESFYQSITQDTPVPIPYEEIVRTADIMDSIFRQIEMNPSLQKGISPVQQESVHV
jgi:predicted dehydrogenase